MADREYTEQLRSGPRDEHAALLNAERDSEILADARRGLSLNAIAQKHGVSASTVQRALKQAAELVRANQKQIAAQVFQRQHDRLEHLYFVANLHIEEYEKYMVERALGTRDPSLPPIQFDDRPFRICVMIMERQAKLHGMDVGASPHAKSGAMGWLNDAPIEQVVEYAKQLKMKTPTMFDIGPQA